MIVFKKLWPVVKKKGVTECYLRNSFGIDKKTIKRLHQNGNVETKTLDKLCMALSCKPEDSAEYVPNKKDEDELLDNPTQKGKGK